MINPYRRTSRRGRTILGVLSFTLVLLVWSLISSLDLVSNAKLPHPLDVLSAFQRLAFGPDAPLLGAAMASLARIATALVLVMLVGIPTGILMGSSPLVNGLLSPLVDPFRSAPIVSLLPLFVMWFGIDEEMKILFLFTCAVVYLVPMVRDAIIAVPYTYWESAKDLGGTDFECITKAVLPLAMPRIFDGIVTCVSILFTYITVAEYVNASSGLGQLIQNARRFSAMDQVLVGIFTIIFISLATHVCLTKIRRLLFHWEAQM